MSYTASTRHAEYALWTDNRSDAAAGNGISIAATNAAAWPSANLAIYVPIRVRWPAVVTKLAVLNGTPSGNVDLGIYDCVGTRLVSTGSTAHSGSGAIQAIDVTDCMIGPGLYYLAAAFDNGTATISRKTPTAPICAALGLYSQTSAFALPATATFAISQTLAYYPVIAALLHTVY